jgi:hypothetical protein
VPFILKVKYGSGMPEGRCIFKMQVWSGGELIESDSLINEKFVPNENPNSKRKLESSSVSG